MKNADGKMSSTLCNITMAGISDVIVGINREVCSKPKTYEIKNDIELRMYLAKHVRLLMVKFVNDGDVLDFKFAFKVPAMIDDSVTFYLSFTHKEGGYYATTTSLSTQAGFLKRYIDLNREFFNHIMRSSEDKAAALIFEFKMSDWKN